MLKIIIYEIQEYKNKSTEDFILIFIDYFILQIRSQISAFKYNYYIMGASLIIYLLPNLLHSGSYETVEKHEQSIS